MIYRREDAIPDTMNHMRDPVGAECDVLVAGFGIAGGCAAVEAAASGANVVMLERAAIAGGTTAMAGGHFYLGGGTVVQRATGHDDSPEEMYKYLMAVTPDPEPEKIRAYCDGAAAHCDWLELSLIHISPTSPIAAAGSPRICGRPGLACAGSARR